jgi:hypothetical protein
MSNAAKSILFFGAYLLALGLILIVAPNPLLSLFDYPRTDEVWIRIVGMLLVGLGFFYVQAARAELTPFFRWSVFIRLPVMIVFAAFVLLGLATPVLILFGVVDLLAAIWTGVALRSSKTVS